MSSPAVAWYPSWKSINGVLLEYYVREILVILSPSFYQAVNSPSL